MSRFNTNNPIDSDDYRDGSDNLKTLDQVVNSSAATVLNRFGVARPTLAGLEALVQETLDPTALARLGDGSPEEGAALVAYGEKTVGQALDERLPEVANYAAVRAGLGGATAVYVRGRANIFDGGAGVFRLKSGDTTTADNGGTVLVDGVSGARYFRDIDKYVSLLWFEGVDPTGVGNVFQPAVAAWAVCLGRALNLYAPAGEYTITSENNFPFGRIDGSTPTALLDCKNITIYGDGPNTVFKTHTVGGADVLQLNGAANLHFRNLKLKSVVTGSAAGSNGISITGGYDNLTFDHIWCENLAFLDKTSHIDGGKALSIQTPVSGQTLKCGRLKATNIFANGCVYGFGIEIDLVAASAMPTSVDVEIIAENCREAVVVSAGEASATLPANWSSGVRVRATAIDCMQDVVLVRAHGVDVSCLVVTTKTKAERLLSYSGSKWFAADIENDVMGLKCAYAHDSHVRIYGNKGDCGYKARVGGAPAGSSGLTGATTRSSIHVELTGTASVADFGEIDFGGNVTSYCTLVAAGDTAAPTSEHYAPSRNNAIVVGNVQTMRDLYVHRKIVFTHADGYSNYAEINYDNESINVKQSGSSSPGAIIQKFLNHSGAIAMAVRNDGCIATDAWGAASLVSGLNGVMAIYDASNNFVGYTPIYSTYTP